MTDGGRDLWIERAGLWLVRHGFEGNPVELGVAYFVVHMKLGAMIEERHPGHGWAKPGSLAHQWAYAYSKAKPSPEETWGQVLAKEIAYAEAQARGESIPVLRHDRRRNRRRPLRDLDVSVGLEPVPRKSRDGRPLAGLDPLLVIYGLHERGFQFPTNLIEDGELETVNAFVTRSDAELANEWRVTPAAVRKRRERLRRRMSELIYREGGFVDAPTMVERVDDHEQRLRELERQVGVPQGGDRAASAAVDAFLREAQAEQIEEERTDVK